VAASLARIVISVADLDRALAFYEGLLGFAVNWRGDEVVRLRSSELDVLLHQRETSPSEHAIALSFAVDDVDTATEAAVALGCELMDSPDDQPWGERQSVLKDPDGHVVCLVKAI
jgi:catechol 2,3-dioxygenase-like lactoylglutathione lyase family enzyme